MVALARYASEEYALAAIESPQYKASYMHCFKFWYNFQVGITHSGLFKAYFVS